MNINVLVLNVSRDAWPSDVREHGRERDEQLARTSTKPATATPVQELIELMPHDGVWVGTRETKTARAAHALSREARALHSSPAVTTYDHKGKAHYAADDKGLQINITA